MSHNEGQQTLNDKDGTAGDAGTGAGADAGDAGAVGVAAAGAAAATAGAAAATAGAATDAANLPFLSILVVGVGLIGGSIAAALKALEGAQPRVRGIDVDASAIETALANGYLDEGATLSKGDNKIAAWLSDAKTDLVILAIPVSAAKDWFERIEASGYTGAITDVASTKGVLTQLSAQILSAPSRFIPGHPMAGSEVNGIKGARATLFANAHWVLCPDQDSSPDIFARLHELVTGLGARSITLPREEHDQTIAVVSHVPHMIASALVQLAGAHAKDRQEIFRLAAGGFKDTTRIAAGSPELWCGIALDNREALAHGLREVREIIAEIEDSLNTGNAQDLSRLLEEAAQLRSSIPTTWVPDSTRLIEVRIPMANHAGVIALVTGFAAKAACNIQSINIEHINEATAMLELILTDEGDKGGFMNMLIESGFDVSFRPLGYSMH